MGFHTVVLVKEIYDTRDLVGGLLDDGGKVRADTLDSRFDPEDLNALEMALKLKDSYGGHVTCLSLGAPRKLDVLRECLYRRADAVVRLDDPAFFGLDTLAAALMLGRGVRRLGRFDLVLTGVQVVEGENSMVGSHVAAELGVTLLSYVEEIEAISPRAVTVRRAVEGGIEVVEAPVPVLLTVGVALLQEDPRTPRSARAKLKLQHKKTPIPCWGCGDLEVERSALCACTTIAGRAAVPQREIPHKQVDGASMGELRQMVEELREGGVLR